MKSDKIMEIPIEKFRLKSDGSLLRDEKLATKPVGYFRDAFRRFCKNKASLVAAIIIILLVLFALFAPVFSPYTVEYRDTYLISKKPKSSAFAWLGWDGCTKTTISATDYWKYKAIEKETGIQVIKKTYDKYEVETQNGTLVWVDTFYDVYIDTYAQDGTVYMLLTADEYKALQEYQDEHETQIIYPSVPERSGAEKYEANIWYKSYASGINKGLPMGVDLENDSVDWKIDYIAYTGSDAYTSKMRVEGEDNYLYNYAIRKQGYTYYVRVSYYKYYEYINGNSPEFLFGTDQYGKDIFVRLASGARFSFFLAICVSAINLTIGAIYGAIEGYFGGATDMVMERISDILSGVPFMVVVTLFKLHLADKIGSIGTLLFAFVTTGWIGMAGTVRMQFYRYKNQEYVLAARTLGAKNWRIMFKHIFPNSLGTIVTSCVLVIPGVIFSESSLSYLGIINLETSSVTSVGTLLASGQGQLAASPHIILFPALFISLLMISFNLFGNGLRDAFNPSLRGTEG